MLKILAQKIVKLVEKKLMMALENLLNADLDGDGIIGTKKESTEQP